MGWDCDCDFCDRNGDAGPDYCAAADMHGDGEEYADQRTYPYHNDHEAGDYEAFLAVIPLGTLVLTHRRVKEGTGRWLYQAMAVFEAGKIASYWYLAQKFLL